MVKIWKDIEGYEGYYQISEEGDVRSLNRLIKRKKVGNYIKKGRLLKKRINEQGYVHFILNGKFFSSHRLVASHFIPNPLNKKEINHKNSIKGDNRIENLEWVTPKENMTHAYKNNLVPILKGEQCGNSKLKEADILKIRELYSTGEYSLRKLAAMYGVTYTLIGYIKRRNIWKHIYKIK